MFVGSVDKRKMFWASKKKEDAESEGLQKNNPFFLLAVLSLDQCVIKFDCNICRLQASGKIRGQL